MANRRSQELWVGALLLGSMLLLGWMAIKVGAIGDLGPQVTAQVRMLDAAGIKDGSAISIAGVDVGRVESMWVEHDMAVADITLSRDAKVRADATLSIRARSVLGEKYLELHPGTPDGPLLEDGAILEILTPQTEIDEMVGELGPLVGALDAEALAAALDAVSKGLAEDPEQIARVMKHTETIAARGAEAAERLPGLLDRLESTLDRADRTLDAFSARAAEAKAPLKRADELMASLDASADRLPGLLDEASGVMDDASATMGDIRTAASEAKDMVGGFDGIDEDVRRVLANVAEIDKWELRRLLREEGILIRLKPRDVVIE